MAYDFQRALQETLEPTQQVYGVIEHLFCRPLIIALRLHVFVDVLPSDKSELLSH